MTPSDLRAILPRTPALIGMVHAPPLPGSPRWGGRFDDVLEVVRADAQALREGGADAILVENFGDAPFYKAGLPPETIAALTRCVLAVRDVAPNLPVGVNALRNDGMAALGIAVATEASFIRVNVLVGAMVTDQGILEGCAAELLRTRRALAPHIAVLADVRVKHAAPLAPIDPAQLVRDTVGRGLADALVVSGTGTGNAPDPEWLANVVELADGAPVLVGSGATAQNAEELPAFGYIVGTSLKEQGRVSSARVRDFRLAIDRAADH
jgi:hypothetical protein